MLKAILSEAEVGALPEALKSEYRKQDDGTFILDVGSVGGFVLEDVTGLRTALSTERKLREDAERAFKKQKAEVGDIDLPAAREALIKIEELGGADGDEKRKKEIEAIRSGLELKFGKDKQSLETAAAKQSADAAAELKTVAGQLSSEMITSRAVQAISAAKGSPVLLTPIIAQRAKAIRQDDGSFDVRIYDAGGNELLSKTPGSVKPMTIKEFVDGLKEDATYAAAFEGSSASGAGGTRSGTGGTPTGTRKIAKSDHAAQSASIEDIASGKAVVVDDV